MQPRKYRNKPTTIDGYTFASLREAARYQDLILLQRAGKICDLVLQPVFPIVVNEQKIAKYIADFQYKDLATGTIITEDSKGVRTPVYRLKKKLVEALYGIVVVEV